MKRRACSSVLIALVLAASRNSAHGQVGRISGTLTVVGAAEPIGAAQLSIPGTRIGTTTRDDGTYTISVQPGTYQVRAAKLGFAPVMSARISVTAGQTTTLDFQLTRQAVLLDSIVVTGYGSQRRRDVTGAIGSVSGDEIEQRVATTVVDALKGKVPGVDITSTAYKPGDQPRVRIRGQRSLKASNDPLYVLDGIPMDGGLNDLPQTDIESVEILKDASATAIYGSRGANGVVLIETRRGLAGRTRIIYDTYLGQQSPLRKVELFDGPGFAEVRREAAKTAKKYKCPPEVAQCDVGDADIFFPIEVQMLKGGQWTDWQSLIIRDGAQRNHQLSIQGGNDRTQFVVSGNLMRQDGIVRGEDFDRKTMRVNVESQANDRLRFGGSALVTRSLQNIGRGDGVYSEALMNSPLGPAFDSTGALIFRPTPDGQRVNPLSDVANYIDERSRVRVFGTLFATYKLADGIHWRMTFGPDVNTNRRGQFRGSETQARFGSGADALIEEDKGFNYTLDNILSVQRNLGANHRFDITGLYSIQQSWDESHNTSVSDLPYEHQRFYNLGSAGTVQSVSSGTSKWALLSFMGRVNYALRDRYLLTLTTRVDGSSRLAPGRKYATFPSVALGWLASEESFLQRRGPLSSLKLRASYGRAGNTSVSPYQTEGGLSRTTYAFGETGAYGYRPGSLANPNLQWEKTDQFDVGLEWGLYDNRITGMIDGYRAYTHDLLMDRQLPATSGYTSVTQNIGETQNTGLELGMSAMLLRSWRGLQWTVDVNWAANKNEIVSLYGGKEDDLGNRWFIGQPINGGGNEVYYDQKFGGIWQLADSLEAKKYAQIPGQIRLVDIDNDGKINEQDRIILGNTYPKWTGSLGTRVAWNQFDFSALATTRQRFMVNNSFRTSNSRLDGRYNNLKVDYWTPTNPSNSNPRPNLDQESPIYGGTRGYEDGSFVKIGSISLGYTIAGKLASRIGAQTLRVYGTAQDPFLFTKFKGLDPEGRTSAGTPSYRTLLLGATAGF